jgi:hypothetical protein
VLQLLVSVSLSLFIYFVPSILLFALHSGFFLSFSFPLQPFRVVLLFFRLLSLPLYHLLTHTQISTTDSETLLRNRTAPNLLVQAQDQITSQVSVTRQSERCMASHRIITSCLTRERRERNKEKKRICRLILSRNTVFFSGKLFIKTFLQTCNNLLFGEKLSLIVMGN